MGIFSKILKGPLELTKISTALLDVTKLLDVLKEYPDNNYNWVLAAWQCRVGIIDVIEKNNYPMHYKLSAIINNKQILITISDAYILSVRRLIIQSEEYDKKTHEIVLSIIEKGDWFYKIEHLIPESKKSYLK